MSAVMRRLPLATFALLLAPLGCGGSTGAASDGGPDGPDGTATDGTSAGDAPGASDAGALDACVKASLDIVLRESPGATTPSV